MQLRRMNIKNQISSRSQHGFSILQIVIVLAIMSVVSVFAVLGLTRAKANLRLQNSVRQLSSYLEKARLDAIKRHGTSSVVFPDTSHYVVTMDFVDDATVVGLNGASKGTIPGAAFNRALTRIWLGDKPIQADLKKAMLGG